jgi:lipopolysaccharide/colanic/teichoic acid biosynthesis glycosyltransferase
MLDSPGSFLYSQIRIGKYGRPFRMYKFRTMVSNHDPSEDQKYMADFVAGKVAPRVNDEGVATFKSAQPAHITRAGRFLRKTSLDELPQLWNVLRGDMSLIGPRPNLPCEVEQYTQKQYQRLAVLPGITGLAQVHGRSMITFDKIVEYDLEYVFHQSLKLDLQILWWTVVQVVARRNVE